MVCRILLVEDQRPLQVIARRVLQNAGYEITVVENGPEALRMVGDGVCFGAVIIDLLPPTYLLLAYLLRERNPTIPIVYFTASGVGVLETARGTHERPIMNKPASFDELLEMLSWWLFGHGKGPTYNADVHVSAQARLHQLRITLRHRRKLSGGTMLYGSVWAIPGTIFWATDENECIERIAAIAAHDWDLGRP